MLKPYYKQILAVLSVVLFIVGIVLFLATISVHHYVKTVNENTIDQIKDVLDTRIKEVYDISFQMSSSIKLKELKYRMDIFSTKSILLTLDYQKTLENFNLYNSYVFLNFAVFLDNNYVIMPSSGQDLASFCHQFYDESLPDGYDVESFIEMLVKTSHGYSYNLMYRSPSGGDLVNQVIPYVKWLDSAREQKRVAVVVLIDARKINDLMAQSVSSERSVLCVVDDSNRIIASNRQLSQQESELIYQINDSDLIQMRAKNNFSAYSRSSSNMSWKYILLADEKESMQALRIMLILLVLICGACIVITFIVSIIIIYRNQNMLKPIVGMLENPKSNYNKKDVLQALKRNIDLMMEDKNRLNKELSQQEAVLREIYLNNFLKGDKVNYEGQLQVLSDIGTILPDGQCYVAILSVYTIPERNLDYNKIQEIKSLIAETIKPFSSDVISCSINSLETALIISARNENTNEFLELIYDFLEEILENKYDAYLLISVGGKYSGNNAIPLSFAEARLVSSTVMADDSKGILWYTNSPLQSMAYYYPPEIESQLVNAVRSGNRPLVERIIKDVFDTNLIEKQISYEFLIMFLNDFYGSIFKMIDGSDIDNPIQKEIYEYYSKNKSNIASMEFQQKFFKFVYKITESYDINKRSHNDKLINDIKHYIEEHFNDYDFTLNKLAEDFSLSSGYLSAFFREQTGVTFSAYLTGIKMKKAKEMILSTEKNVNEISLAVGYGSANTFCRAFKKYYGISPIEMRSIGR